MSTVSKAFEILGIGQDVAKEFIRNVRESGEGYAEPDPCRDKEHLWRSKLGDARVHRRWHRSQRAGTRTSALPGRPQSGRLRPHASLCPMGAIATGGATDVRFDRFKWRHATLAFGTGRAGLYIPLEGVRESRGEGGVAPRSACSNP